MLIDEGIESTLAPDNRLVAEKVRVIGDTASPRLASLFDPQTSGGLLLAVAADVALDVERALRDAGCSAARIGEVVAAESAPQLQLR